MKFHHFYLIRFPYLWWWFVSGNREPGIELYTLLFFLKAFMLLSHSYIFRSCLAFRKGLCLKPTYSTAISVSILFSLLVHHSSRLLMLNGG